MPLLPIIFMGTVILGGVLHAIIAHHVPDNRPPLQKYVDISNSSDPSVYFKFHVIRNSDQNGAYCIQHRAKRHRAEFMEHFPLDTQNGLIQRFQQQANDANIPEIFALSNLPSPFTEVVVHRVTYHGNPTAPVHIEIPLYFRATIRFGNLQPSNTRRSIPEDVRIQMSLMDEIQLDEAGHGLAFALGGGMNNVWNYLPQTNRLNRHAGGYSLWLGEEIRIATFLRNNQRGRVEWSLVVIYARGSLRPFGFCLHHTDYDDLGNPTYNNEIQ